MPETEALRVQLQNLLTGAGLLKASGKWDSLDAMAVVVATETALNVEIDADSITPDGLRTFDDLLRLVAERSSPRRSHPNEVERRRTRLLEYRIALRYDQVRALISPDQRMCTLQSTSAGPLPWSQILASEDSSVTAAVSGMDGVLPVWPARDTAQEANEQRVASLIRSVVEAWVAEREGRLLPGPPPLISGQSLRRLGYLEAHPEQAFHVRDDIYLLPAACLGLYESLSSLPDRLYSFDAPVFRRELNHSPDVRRAAFSVRELVVCGHPEFVADEVAAVEQLIISLANQLGIDGMWTSAPDPFFLRHDADRQAPEGHKREFVSAGVALASTNLHGRHFADRVALRAPLETACVGLGHERWAAATTLAGGSRA